MKFSATSVFTMFAVLGGGGAGACGMDKPPPGEPGLDVGWIKSTLVVYGVDDGELYEARLDSRRRKRLARVHGKAQDVLAISPDGRYLVYVIATGDDASVQQFHLLDRTHGIDRVVPVLKQPGYAWKVEFLGFSPDSRSLVWLHGDGYTVPGTSEKRPELIVFSTTDHMRRALPYPPAAKPGLATRSCFTPQWSADGRSLYANFMEGGRCLHLAKDDRTLVHFRIDLASGASTVVDGGYTFDPGGYFFRSFYVDNGTPVSSAYLCLRSRGCRAYGQVLEGGGMRAWLQHVDDPRAEIRLLDGPEELYVQVGDAPPRKVAVGWTSSCAGTDIRLIDWVENGKYLLYSHQGNTYLHAVAENRTIPLPQLSGAFDWLPIATQDRLHYEASSGNGDERRYGPASAGN